MKIFDSLTQLIGATPLLKISRYSEAVGLKTALLAKLEYFNPAGSAKDRVARAIIEQAERDGTLNKNSVIIESTSGNTGIGIAAVAASKGYKVIIVMPENMSDERKKLMRAYGAELILTEKAFGMRGATEKAEALARETEGAILAGQFVNPANPKAHYETTGPEIWNDTEGQIDIFVAGVGTGGTISGVGKYLKEKNPNIKVIAAEPADSPLLSSGKSGPHKIQGIGANFIPDTLDKEIIDEIIPVPYEEALTAARTLAATEGTLVGISSGAALYAAVVAAKKSENEGKNVVVLLPDTGERYLSTELFA